MVLGSLKGERLYCYRYFRRAVLAIGILDAAGRNLLEHVQPFGYLTHNRVAAGILAALPRTAPAPGAPLRWARPGVLAAVPHPDGTGSILVARGRTVTVPGVEAEAFTRLTEATTSMAAFTLDQLAAALPSALDTAERDRIARTLHTTGAVIAR